MSFKQDPNDPTKLVPDAPATDFLNAIPKGSWAPIVQAISATDGTSYTECRSVWVGRGGDITFTMTSGDTAAFHNIDDGTLLPLRVTKWTDLGGSGATNILFLY
tara:strand:- start:386 stop:697 length:312 start_codon:yes stop_codon:yes gene_type:complete